MLQEDRRVDNLSRLFGVKEVIVRSKPLHRAICTIKSVGHIARNLRNTVSAVQEAAKPDIESMLEKGADLIRLGKVRFHTSRGRIDDAELVIQGPISDKQDSKGNLAFMIQIPRGDSYLAKKITDVAVLILSGNRVILTGVPQGKINVKKIVAGKIKEPTQTVVLKKEQAQLAKDIRSSYVNCKNRRLLLAAIGIAALAVAQAACGFEPVVGVAIESKPSTNRQLVPKLHLSTSDVIILEAPQENTEWAREFYKGAAGYYYISHPNIPNFRIMIAIGDNNSTHTIDSRNITKPGFLKEDILNMCLHVLYTAQEARMTLIQGDFNVPEVITIYGATHSEDFSGGKAIADNFDPKTGTHDPCGTTFYRPVVAFNREQYAVMCMQAMHEIAHTLGIDVHTLFEGAADAIALKHSPEAYDKSYHLDMARCLIQESVIPTNIKSYSCYGFFFWLSSELGISLESLISRFVSSWKKHFCPQVDEANFDDLVIRDVLTETQYKDFSFVQIFSTWMAYIINSINEDTAQVDEIHEEYRDQKNARITSILVENPHYEITQTGRTTWRGNFNYYRLDIHPSFGVKSMTLTFKEDTIIITSKDINGGIYQIHSGDRIPSGQEIFVMNYGSNNFCVGDECPENIIHVDVVES